MRKLSGGWFLEMAAAGVAGLTLFTGLPVLAQQTPGVAQTPAFTLKASVNRVLVDVVVTDAHGNPVHGLTKSDFTVAEDGVPQKMLAFDAHDFDQMAYVPPKMPALPADSFVNLPTTPERGPLYLLLYDLVNIPQQYQVVARAQLVKFIKNKPAGARFAILVSSDGIHVVQGFTADKQKLLAAVDPNGSRAHVPSVFLMGPNFGEGDKLATMARLNSIARYLAPMPGRKNLIWFSAEFPLSLFPNSDDTESYRTEIKKTLNLLADNQIAVYPVDASGVVTYEAYAPPEDSGGPGIINDDRQKGLTVPGSSKAAPPAKGGKGPGYSLLGASYMTQDEIAKMTGGEAVYSSNDITGALEKVTENGGNYYTLSYSPTNRNFDGGLRHIEVKLTEGKYHLTYRRAYYGLPDESADAPPEDAIEASMKYGAPESHQLIFGVHLSAGSPRRGTREQMAGLEKAEGGKKSLRPVKLRTYAIDYTVMTPQLRMAGETSPELEIAAAVYDGDGRVLNSTVNKVEAGPAEHVSKAYRMEVALAAPLDAKSMRVAVRDARTGRVGAMAIELPLK
ncbi:MAG: VWA domain-containing protein [Acidobacteriaceae bacterium]